MEGSVPGSQCILIADAEIVVRSAVAEYLRTCGYKAIEAACADDAITLLTSIKALFAAALVDADLPGSINAFELRLWIRKHFPDMKVVLAGNLASAAEAAGELCATGPHLRRPYDPKAVVDYIRRTLTGAL